MNVYDFDGTIYDGDSSFDFLLFLAAKKPLKMLKASPSFLEAFLSYKSGKTEKEAMKEVFFSILQWFPNPYGEVEEFWRTHLKKIKKFYYHCRKEDDVIISASPEFLLRPVAQRFGFYLLASPIDIYTGHYQGVNCHGAEKIRRLKEVFGEDVVVEEFYSDAAVDGPMAEFAQKAFLVKGEKITDWPF